MYTYIVYKVSGIVSTYMYMTSNHAMTSKLKYKDAKLALHCVPVSRGARIDSIFYHCVTYAALLSERCNVAYHSPCITLWTRGLKWHARYYSILFAYRDANFSSFTPYYYHLLESRSIIGSHAMYIHASHYVQVHNLTCTVHHMYTRTLHNNYIVLQVSSLSHPLSHNPVWNPDCTPGTGELGSIESTCVWLIPAGNLQHVMPLDFATIPLHKTLFWQLYCWPTRHVCHYLVDEPKHACVIHWVESHSQAELKKKDSKVTNQHDQFVDLTK